MSAGLDRGAAAFGVLRLGAVEVAIPAANLQEAVVWPSGITPRPRSAPYILGTFNLRGMAIPTIDLRVLLANADAQAKPLPLSGQEKVVIVRHPAGRMGLVVDAVSEVMRLPADRMHGLVCGSPTATRESSLIKSLFMADGGSRLVHVLDLDILASFPDVMLAHVAEATTSITTQRGPRHHYLTFRCAELDLCLDATAVRQIIEAPVIERTFLTNELCRGFVHQRGQAVPVLRACQGSTARSERLEGLIV